MGAAGFEPFCTSGRGAGRRAYRRGEGVLGVLLHLGAFNIENAPRCILVAPYIYIYNRGNESSRLRLVGEAPVRTWIGHHPA
jgi:hypothetical protein